MFKRSDYLAATPLAVIGIIQAAHDHEYMHEEEWGDDVADALSAAQDYVERRGASEAMHQLVEDAAYLWNEEGNMAGTIESLASAFRQ